MTRVFSQVDNPDGTTSRKQLDPSEEHKGYEKQKEALRNKLINVMTALYATGAKVIAFNNSGDELVAKVDQYQSRVWCYQARPRTTPPALVQEAWGGARSYP
jgi:hypothetical protein